MIRINKRDFWLFLILFSFMEPWWFTTIGIIDKLFDAFKFLMVLVVVIKMFKGELRIGPMALLILCHRTYICVVSVLRGLMIMGYISESIQFIAFAILLEYYIRKDGCRTLLSVEYCFATLLVLNILTYTPSGIIFEPGSGYYLLSIRTRIAEVAFPAIGLALYNVKLTGTHKKALYVILLSSLAFFILEWVATALVCLSLFVILLVFEKFVSKKALNSYHVVLLLGLVGISIGVVFFNIQEYFADLIEMLLHKKATLTGRTDLWAIAIAYTRKKWLFGYGFQNRGDFVSMYDFTTTSHNQWLQTLYYGGVVGSIFFYSITIYAISRCFKDSKQQGTRVTSVLLAMLFTIIFMCTTEIVMDNVYYLIYVIILCYSGQLVKNREGEYYAKKHIGKKAKSAKEFYF